MTIKTLERIHRLLQEDFEKHTNALEIARKAKHDAEDAIEYQEADPAQFKDVFSLYDYEYRAKMAAEDALDDFETQQF